MRGSFALDDNGPIRNHRVLRATAAGAFMSVEDKKQIELEIAHVLFIDMVGYSKMLIDEQHECLDILNQVIRSAEAFRTAEAADKLIRLPTGDGMALAFFVRLDEPVLCAMQISKALKAYPEVQVRMGVHSGPVGATKDVNDKVNVAGAGINMAQRVMDCGDAGHILLSRHVAEDLLEYRQWKSRIHELGPMEVKHGVELSLFNFYSEEFGNSDVPKKFGRRLGARRHIAGRAWRKVALYAGSVLLLLALATFGILSHRAASRSTTSTAGTGMRDKSVAVLPFDNLSDDKQNAYFADGVQDEILTNLAKIADLKVISRTSVMQYRAGATPRNLREIGKALGVEHLLEGSVQRADNRVRINAQLIDARTDAHLWAQTYDRELANVFAIQSEIAKTIADQLRAKLSPSEKAGLDKPSTTNLVAFDLYLRAQALYADKTDPARAKGNLPEAVRLLDDAVGRDPRFLAGWCLLSRVHTDIYWSGFDRTPARLARAKSALETALALDPDAGEAHLALAAYHYRGFRDYEHARSELAIARRTLPNNAEVFSYTGNIDRREGHWREATQNLERTLELDPRNIYTLQQLALAYHRQRRYADFVRIYDRALAIMPGDPVNRVERAKVALDWQADIKPYQEILATLATEDPRVVPDVEDPLYALCERSAEVAARVLKNLPLDGAVAYGVNCPHAFWEGVVARGQGNKVKAQAAFAAARGEVEKIVEKQPDFAAAISLLGMIDAGLGQKEKALSEGRRACELLPISKDAIDGVAHAVNLAHIYAWIGEEDLAIEQIATIERIPNALSYGFLKLQPFWDSLRGDARFEQIVASLAPHETK